MKSNYSFDKPETRKKVENINDESDRDIANKRKEDRKEEESDSESDEDTTEEEIECCKFCGNIRTEDDSTCHFCDMPVCEDCRVFWEGWHLEYNIDNYGDMCPNCAQDCLCKNCDFHFDTRQLVDCMQEECEAHFCSRCHSKSLCETCQKCQDCSGEKKPYFSDQGSSCEKCVQTAMDVLGIFIIPSSICSIILGYIDIEHATVRKRNKKARRNELIIALKGKNLELRSDSRLCKSYIDGKTNDLSYVVSTMEKMNFYFNETEYESCLSDEIEGALEDRGRFDRYQCSEVAKFRAIELYAKKCITENKTWEELNTIVPTSLLGQLADIIQYEKEKQTGNCKRRKYK